MQLFKKILITLFCSTFLFSCVTPKTLIIGSWECTKISSPNVSMGSQPQKEDEESSSNKTNIVTDPMAQKVLPYLPNFSKQLQFKNDKTAVFTGPNKVYEGTWSVNTSGKTISFTDSRSKNTFWLTYISISKTQLVLFEHLPIGDVTIAYEKK